MRKIFSEKAFNTPAEETVSKRIFWMSLLAGLGTICAGILIVLWLAMRVDHLADQKSIELVNNVLAGEMDQVEVLTEDYGLWDTAYLAYQARDEDALFENMGISATEQGVFAELHLVDADGTPQYSYLDGVPGHDPSRYPQNPGDALVRDVRSLPETPYQSVAYFAVRNGVPMIFVAARLQPTEIGDIALDSLPVIIGARAIDEDMTDAIGERLFLRDFRVVVAPETAEPGESKTPLLGQSGEPIAYAVWRTESPSIGLIIQLLPYLLIVSSAFIAVNVFLSRAYERQTRGYLEERLNARTDGLTKLTNRAGLDELVDRPDFKDAVAKGHVGVIYIDVNSFKQLNDTLGHAAGDEVLKVIAERLRQSTRRSDHVVRLGGDEFICILRDENLDTVMKNVHRRFQDAMQAPLTLDGNAVTVSAAMGLAKSEAHETWDTFLARADQTMYDQKRKRKALKNEGA